MKLNNGATVKLLEPILCMGKKAFQVYSNSDYKIWLDEKANVYYITIDNDIVCGPTNWGEIHDFFEDLYKLFIE